MSTTLSIKSTDIPVVATTSYRSKRPVLFRGAPGIGKTELIHETASRLSSEYGETVHVCTVHLASVSDVDLRGYLRLDGEHSLFTKPFFWHIIEQYARGILFLDEFAQASPEVQKAASQLLLERRIGEWALPEGWAVMAASNRSIDRAGTNTLLSHIVNRLIIVDVEAPEVDHWVAWAARADLVPELVAFAKLRPGVVFESGVPEDEDMPYCTARSLHAASDAAKAYPGGIRGMVNSRIGQAMLAGAIGKGAASELSAVVTMAHNLPTYEEVVSAPETCPVPSKPDEAYAAAMLAAVRCKPEHREQVMTYICRMQPNIALVGILAACSRDSNCVGTAAARSWVDNNREMIGKLGGFIQFN